MVGGGKLLSAPREAIGSDRTVFASFRKDLARCSNGPLDDAEIRRLASKLRRAQAQASKGNGSKVKAVLSEGEAARDSMVYHAVRKIVVKTAIGFTLNYRGKSSFTFMDFVQAGSIGAIQAAMNYDPTNKAAFNTFAATRIRGAMYDELRSCGGEDIHIPRRAFYFAKENTIKAALQKKLGRDPTNHEVYLERKRTNEQIFYSFVPLDEPLKFHNMKDDDHPQTTADILPSKTASPDHVLFLTDRGIQIDMALDNLSKQEQFVLKEYFYNNKSLKEIAELLDISESRASQVKTGATAKLGIKGALLDYMFE
jgi:RNA polymerase sigma factor for flagellar operon FliA